MSDSEIKDVFERAFRLPSEERVRLAHALIDSLAPDIRPNRRMNLASLRGLLASDQPPPTDEEVKQMIDEHRIEKYGR